MINAITIINPYAALFFLPRTDPAWKGVENRVWLPPEKDVGRLMVIHAGMAKSYGNDSVESLCRKYGQDPARMVYGAALGVGRLVGYATGGSAALIRLYLGDKWPWLRNHCHAFGPYCWVIEDATAFSKPLRCRGQQGIWKVDPALVEAGLGRRLHACPQCGDWQLSPQVCPVCGHTPEAGAGAAYNQSIIDSARAQMRPRRRRF